MTYGVRRTYPFLRDTRRRGARLREEIIEFAFIRKDAEVGPHRNVVAYDRCQPRGFGLVPRNAPCVKGLLEDLVGFEGKIRKRHRLERKHLFARRRRPPQRREVIEKRGSEVPFFAVAAHGHVARSFRELGAVGAEMERIVGVDRPRIAERFLNENLARRVGDVVFSPDDVRDAHFAVVNDDREIVERVVYCAGNRKIFELRRVEGNVAAYNVGKGDDFAGVAHTYHAHRFARFLLTLLFREVRLIFVYELLQHFRVRADELRRAVKFVPREAEPVQLLDDVLFVFPRTALLVVVFAAENDNAAVLAGEEIIEYGHPRRAHVAIARRARRKSDADITHTGSCTMEVSSNASAIFCAASGREKARAAVDILVRRAASPTMRCISATSKCGERFCCSITTAASERAYEKAFSVWSCDTSFGMGIRMAGSPQLAISKMVPEPARATIIDAIPAAIRNASVLRSPKIL